MKLVARTNNMCDPYDGNLATCCSTLHLLTIQENCLWYGEHSPLPLPPPPSIDFVETKIGRVDVLPPPPTLPYWLARKWN